MKKKLKDLIELSASVAIYVPSTVNVNGEASINMIQEQVDRTLVHLSDTYGGATAIEGLGCWQSAKDGLVKERVTVCKAYCNTEALGANIESTIAFCEGLRVKMSQEAIALEVNNKLHFV